MTTTPDFRAELKFLVELYEELGGNWTPHGYTDNWNDALASARAALATPPPGPPADGDKEESERLRSLFDLTRHQMADALGVDRGYGWTSLAMEARQLREDRAPNFCALCAALDLEAMKLYDKGYLPKPPPEPPTAMQILELSGEIEAALKRWVT